MSSLAAIEKLAGVFPAGRIRQANSQKGMKVLWEWGLHGKEEIERALRAMLPFLTAKRAEAQEVVQLLQALASHPPKRAYSPQESCQVQAAWQRLTELKHAS